MQHYHAVQCNSEKQQQLCLCSIAGGSNSGACNTHPQSSFQGCIKNNLLHHLQRIHSLLMHRIGLGDRGRMDFDVRTLVHLLRGQDALVASVRVV